MQNFWKWLALCVAVAGGGFAVFQVNESLTRIAGLNATQPPAGNVFDSPALDDGSAAIEPTLASTAVPSNAPDSEFVPVDRFAAESESPADLYDDLVPAPNDDFASVEATDEADSYEDQFAAEMTEQFAAVDAADDAVDLGSLRAQSPESLLPPMDTLPSGSTVGEPAAVEPVLLAQADTRPSFRDKLGQIGARLRGEPRQAAAPVAQPIQSQTPAAPPRTVNEFDGLMNPADLAAQQQAAMTNAAQAAPQQAAAAFDSFAAEATTSIDTLGAADPFAGLDIPEPSAAPVQQAMEPAMAAAPQAIPAPQPTPQPTPIQSAADFAAQAFGPTEPAAAAAPQTAAAPIGYEPSPSPLNPLDAAAVEGMNLMPTPTPEAAAIQPTAGYDDGRGYASDFGDFGPTPAANPRPIGQGVPTPAAQPPSSDFGFDDEPTPANFDLSARDRRREATPDRIRVESTPMIINPMAVESDQPQRVAARDLSDQLIGRSTIDRDVVRGPVQPELQILKQAPKKASIGEPFVYTIVVKNVGRSAANKVVVEDRVPKGSRLSGTIPKAEMSTVRDESVLFWEYDQIGPGQQEQIRVRIVPTASGQIGSITTVRMVAETAAETIVTAPVLGIELIGPTEAQLGEVVKYRYEVTNTGTEDAFDVVLNTRLPEGLKSPKGSPEITYPVGTLRAGETKSIPLPVRADKTGSYDTEAQVQARGNVTAMTTEPIDIIKSRLSIERTGLGKRFVGSSTEFVNVVRNNSSRTLRNVRIVEELPDEADFATATENGSKQAGGRSIVWMIPSLPPGGSRELSSTIVPRRPGQALSTVRAESEDGSRAIVKSELAVVGFSSLKVEADHANAPFPVGEQMPLKVRIRNGGSAAAHVVGMDMFVPENLRIVKASGPKPHLVNGSTISFEPIETVEIGQTLEYNLLVEAIGEGNGMLRMQLRSRELGSSPMLHDERLRTYIEDYSR